MIPSLGQRSVGEIGDFRKWKNDDLYQKALLRLIRDLQPEEKIAKAAA